MDYTTNKNLAKPTENETYDLATVNENMDKIDAALKTNDDAITQLNENKANKDHTHKWSAITEKPSSFTPASHTHDDRYYTESEINTKMNAKLDKSLIKKTTITTTTPNWTNLFNMDRIILSAVVTSTSNGTTNYKVDLYYNKDAKGTVAKILNESGQVAPNGTYNIEIRYINLLL